VVRGRGIARMRRGPGGLFSLSSTHKRCGSMRVSDIRYRLIGGLPGIATDGGLSVYLTPAAVLQRYGRGACMNVDEEAVRQLAQLIWETEGQPEGQEARHWEMATKLAESAAMAPVRTSHRHRTTSTLFPAPDEKSEDR
jgi:hypothetical protein